MSDEARLIIFIWTGLLGLLVGSFLNVCIFRLPRNCMSVVRPRSKCPKCRSLIAWYDNIPVLSWILLGGKCRRCGVRISPRYAGVELLTAALFLAAAWEPLYVSQQPGPREASVFVVRAWFVACLIVCTFIDIDFRILPDEITIVGTVLGLLVAVFLPFLPFMQGDVADVLRGAGLAARALGMSGAVESLEAGVRWLARMKAEQSRILSLGTSLLGAATGWFVIYAIATLGKRIFRKKMESLGQQEVMGFGDVKYMAMLGSVLGWRGVLFTLILACFVGSVWGVVKRVVTGTMGYVPFGPFLSAGALVMLLWSRWVDRGVEAYIYLIRSATLP